MDLFLLGPQRNNFHLLYRTLVDAGAGPSAGIVGKFYDNALAETINGAYEAEVIHRRPQPNAKAVELASLGQCDLYKPR